MPKTITNSEDDLAVLVDVMLDLNKKIETAKGSRRKHIQRQIDPVRNIYCGFEVIFLKALDMLVSIISNGVEKTDKEIDDLVYKFYGITEEERKIIEGGL